MARWSVAARRLAALATAFAAAACTDEPPTAVGPSPEGDESVEAPGQTLGGSGIFGERVHVLTEEDFELASTATELTSGLYRFRPRGTEATPEIRRDEFIVAREPNGAALKTAFGVKCNRPISEPARRFCNTSCSSRRTFRRRSKRCG